MSDETKSEERLGFRFGGKLTQEAIDAKVAQYKAEGWTHVESVGRLCFASEDGRWWHTWDCETGRGLFIDAEWVKNLRMVPNGSKQEKGVETSEEEVR